MAAQMKHINNRERDVELNQSTDSENFEDAVSKAVPEGGYGWVVVGCIIGVNAVTWGVNTTFGVYISFYIQHNYFPGGTTLRYAFVGGLCVAAAMLCAPLANYLSKHFGFRTPMIIGAAAVVLGQCMAAISKNFSAFMVCQGLLSGSGLGLTLIPSQPLLAHWFDKRLSLAQGFANAGSGLGGLVLSNTTRLAIENVGVKYALILNGGISAVILIPAITLLRGRFAEVEAKTEALQYSFLWHRGFFWVWTWGAFAMMGYFVALYTLASFTTNGLGLSQTLGAGLQSILAAGQMLGRPICGLALDKGGRINMTIIFHLIAGLSCIVIWLPARSFGILVFFAVVQGWFGGTVWSAATPVVAQTVSVQDLGSALAIFWLSTVIPVTFAPAIAVALMNYSRSHLGRTGADAYLISIGFCGGVFCFSGILLYGVKWHLQKSPKLLQKT